MDPRGCHAGSDNPSAGSFPDGCKYEKYFAFHFHLWDYGLWDNFSDPSGRDRLVCRSSRGSGRALTVTQIVGHNYSATSVVIGIAGGLLLGCVVGLVHGLIVTQFGVPAFLITLASQNIVYGIAQLLTGNNVIPCMEPASFAFLGGGRLLGVPFSIYIMAIMAVLSYIILNKTVFGRNVYAVGGNPEACRLSGVRSRLVTIAAYVASGFTAALAGIVLASMNRQAIAKAAQGYDNFVLTALVVGGASLMGGEGSVLAAIWGHSW